MIFLFFFLCHILSSQGFKNIIHYTMTLSRLRDLVYVIVLWSVKTLLGNHTYFFLYFLEVTEEWPVNAFFLINSFLFLVSWTCMKYLAPDVIQSHHHQYVLFGSHFFIVVFKKWSCLKNYTCFQSNVNTEVNNAPVQSALKFLKWSTIL